MKNSSWLTEFYHEVGRETSLAHTVLNDYHRWSLTVAIGLLTAVALASDTVLALPALAVSLGGSLLLFRFFVRSSIAYVNLHRWNQLSRAIISYWESTNEEEAQKLKQYVDECIRVYYHEWKSPISMRKIVKDNLKLAYLWLGLILAGLIAWSWWTVRGDSRAVWLVLLWTTALAFEVYWFITYRMFQHVEVPTPSS